MKNLLLFSFLLINLSIVAQRDPRPKDQANVFWDGTYPLYSLTSDQEIKPNSSGKYDFWGTTNENPVPKEYSLPKGSKLNVYKFISYDECLKFSNEIRQKKGLTLINSDQISQQVTQIGEQIWMSTNLKVTNFSNGDPIPEAKSTEEWIKAGKEGKPVWCYYNNDPKYDAIYGKLYNWYAVSDSRGLAPKNWRIPSDMDWESLIQNQGGDQIATTKLKSKENWLNNNGGTNSSGLSIIPSGLRYDNGSFGFIQTYGIYWSSTSKDNLNAYYRYIDYPQGKISKMAHDKSHGFAVRCIQDINSNQPVISVNTTQNTDTIYTGQLVKNKYGYSGNGEIKYPNGFRYKGGIINNKPDGKSCEIQTAYGSLFIGNFKLNNGKISGNGTCNPGDGKGGFNSFDSQEGEFIENPSGPGAQLINGTYKINRKSQDSDTKVTKTMKNGTYISVNAIDKNSKDNSNLEINIPNCKDDLITGNYSSVYYVRNIKKIEYELEVIPNKTPIIKKIKDANGVVYSSDLTFGSTPLTLNGLGDFVALKGPFKRITDGKIFYLDGSFNLTENQSTQQGVLSKEQFIQAVNKEQNKVYECDCCKKAIPGYKKGITKEGEEWSDFLIEMNTDASPEMVYIISYKLSMDLAAKAPNLYKNQDLSPIHFMQVNYPYCSKFCYKTCKE